MSSRQDRFTEDQPEGLWKRRGLLRRLAKDWTPPTRSCERYSMPSSPGEGGEAAHVWYRCWSRAGVNGSPSLRRNADEPRTCTRVAHIWDTLTCSFAGQRAVSAEMSWDPLGRRFCGCRLRSLACGYLASMDNERRLPIENVYRVAEGMTHSRPWVRSLFVKAVTSYVDDGNTAPDPDWPPVAESLSNEPSGPRRTMLDRRGPRQHRVRQPRPPGRGPGR